MTPAPASVISDVQILKTALQTFKSVEEVVNSKLVKDVFKLEEGKLSCLACKKLKIITAKTIGVDDPKYKQMPGTPQPRWYINFKKRKTVSSGRGSLTIQHTVALVRVAMEGPMASTKNSLELSNTALAKWPGHLGEGSRQLVGFQEWYQRRSARFNPGRNRRKIMKIQLSLLDSF